MAGWLSGNCGLFNGLKSRFRPSSRVMPPSTLVTIVLVWLTINVHHCPVVSLALVPAPASSLVVASDNLIDWNPSSPQTCQPIDAARELCLHIPYNYTTMPNLVGQQDVTEAIGSIRSFDQLIRTRCSELAEFFICSVYLPMCARISPTEIVTVPPCRPLCEEVRDKCVPVLNQFSYPWPTVLACDNFPERNSDTAMCMPGPGRETVSPLQPEPTVAPSASPKAPLPLPPAICPGPDHAFVFLNATQRCVLSCGASYISTSEEKLYAEIFHGVISGLTFLAAIIVAIRFVFQGRRTTQQEKPLFFVLGCLVMVGIGYVVRLAVGWSVGCGRTEEGKAYVLASGGDVPQPGCLAVFFLLYYFGLAANCWWLTLTFTWFCSAVQGGKKQQINGLLKRCHIFAWLIPALMVALAVALKFVDSDELTALCFVGQQNSSNLFLIVLVPIITITTTGFFVLVFGFAALRKRRSILLAKHKLASTKPVMVPPPIAAQSQQDERLFILCVLYLPSTLTVIGCLLTDFSAGDDHGVTRRTTHVPLYFVRILMQSIYGLVAAGYFCATAKRLLASSTKTRPINLVIPTSESYHGTSIMKGGQPSTSVYSENMEGAQNLYNSVASHSPNLSIPASGSTQFPQMAHLYNARLAKLTQPDWPLPREGQSELLRQEQHKRSYLSVATANTTTPSLGRGPTFV
ncbi:hypothetical protein RvY_11427 [Ramazzottius varieornatus]|uniref:Uncharacterized protein n=1 Tax=Ramazzottius varieornatus TaxID=947166 RepID=A0A1D1VI56_RAMVA|nr:hypothetical protein RvY_11427 [Ramazzottius varieornatus]